MFFLNSFPFFHISLLYSTQDHSGLHFMVAFPLLRASIGVPSRKLNAKNDTQIGTDNL
jgi:hypothetical protein